MESRHGNTLTASEPTATRQAEAAKGLMEDLKAAFQRAQEKTVEQAKAADKLVHERPYQTIGIAFAIGVLIGVLARRK